MAEEVLLTQEGYDKLVAEHEYLITVRRPEVSEHLKEAKSYGDLSENAEYDAAKNEQVEVEERIAKLEAMIHNAKVVSEDEISGDTVNLGLTVKLKDLATKETFTYTIVGVTDADPLNDMISNESPVGKALIGKKKGDKVEITIETKEGTDNMVLRYQIMGISKE
ncbi:MAG: transcription elongation factor GreA [Clostridiales bacterium]|nr:transcription elongation factor GreA [Bacillota bacterium]MBR6483526.1 transcription elongation factor GreA [Clostridiales bacterium]